MNVRVLQGDVRVEAIGADDRGLNYGDGLFETILVHEAQPVWWREHWQRLARGAAVLRIPLPDEAVVRREAEALVSGQVFPWWKVPELVLAADGVDVQVGNAVQWLSEEHPALYEAFPEAVLRCKVRQFFRVAVSEESSQSALLEFLLAESV